MTSKPALSEDGVTLVELLISIVVIGIIMSTIAASLMFVLRTSNTASNRIDDSRGAQGLATYFTADAQSTAHTTPIVAGVDQGFDTAANIWGCGAILPPAPSANVVSLAWVDGGGKSRRAYRYEQRSGDWVLVRYSCVNGGTPTQALVVARGLAPPPVGWTGNSSVPVALAVPDDPGSIRITLTAKNGFTYSVTGANLDGTTNVCSAQLVANPPAVALTGPSTDTLASPVTLTATMGSGCQSPSSYSVVFTTLGGGTAQHVLPLTGASTSTLSAVIPAGAFSWTPAVTQIAVLQLNGGSVGVGSLETYVPTCAASLNLSTSAVTINGGGHLTQPVTATATIQVGTCPTPLRLTYPQVGSTATVTMTGPATPTGAVGETWTYVFGGGGENWPAGANTLKVLDGSGNATGGTAVLTTSDQCRMSSAAVSINPNPGEYKGTSSRNDLKDNISVSFNATGACQGPLRVSFNPGIGGTQSLTAGTGNIFTLCKDLLDTGCSLPSSAGWAQPVTGTPDKFYDVTLTFFQSDGSSPVYNTAGTAPLSAVLRICEKNGSCTAP
jgi:prepilin-type N-terminal cleavage/methylation domain-containing protein